MRFQNDESAAVSILRDEFVVLKNRNASEDEILGWRSRISERFPGHDKERLLEGVRDSLGG